MYKCDILYLYNVAHVREVVIIGRINFTTTLNEQLLELLRIQAIKEKRNINDILEELIKKYLESK